MRKFFCWILCAALFAGGMGVAAQAASEPTRIVSTFYGAGTQGFHWYTAEPAESRVTVDGTDYTGTSVSFQGRYAHRAVVTGLAPGAHTYQIGGQTGGFTVDPGPGNDFTFVAIADVQASSQEDYDNAAQVLASAYATAPNAAFAVNLGDYTNDSNNEQWDCYFNAFQPLELQRTHVPVAGNHDGNLKWNWFRRMFTLPEPDNKLSNLTGVYYSFDYGDAHFAVLNSNDMYPMSMQQRNWLINDMSRSAAKWKILLMHRAVYSAGKNINKPDTLLMRRQLLPIIDSLGIDLVLTGHDHMYYRSVPVRGGAATEGGTVHVVPNNAGPKRYSVNQMALPPILELAAKAEQPGKPVYTTITVAGGSLSYQACTFDAQGAALYDSFTLTKTAFAQPDPAFVPLPTDFWSTLPTHLWNLTKGVAELLFVDYIGTLLPRALAADTFRSRRNA
jgi:predicted phosphodiesterase